MKEKIARISVTLKSKSPLLMNPMTGDMLEELRTKVRKTIRTDTPVDMLAAQKIYKNEAGQIGIPTLNLTSSLMEAGRSVKSGKKQLSTATSSIIPSFLTINEEFMVFDRQDTPSEKTWVTDRRRGVLQKDKIPVCVIRPKFPEWSASITIDVDTAICSESTVKELFEIAGNAIGLCDFRPSKKGPFGRFSIASWETISN